MKGTRHSVLNDVYFDYFLDVEIDRAKRYQNYVSVLNIKMDNDDSNLNEKFLAPFLSEELREADIIGYNKEEGYYSVILLHADLENTKGVGERLRNKVITYASLDDRKNTISIGAACCPVHGGDPKNLKEHAKKMLQKAQEEGGNKIYC